MKLSITNSQRTFFAGIFYLSKQAFRKAVRCSFAFAAVVMLFSACQKSSGIRVQNMQMTIPSGNNHFSEDMLQGAIEDTRISHVILAGPVSIKVPVPADSTSMFLFVKGNGKLLADTLSYEIVQETIAIPFSMDSVVFDVSAGDTLHFLSFTKKITDHDKLDQQTFPAENQYAIYFKKFSDCEAYTEKIKSPNTVSRTVLHKDIVPRVSLGTVEAPGPDAVGAHKHPMLEQLFLGLATNDIVVYADDQKTAFDEFSLLHIPLGSNHWVTVDEGKHMYYMWMDFFISKEGQEWLKTHQAIDSTKKQ